MTDKNYADSLDSLRKTQRELLRMFVEVCEREGFEYFAMFGTMIGAVRHGGFIPWDDDIDVAMPRCDYDRLSRIEFPPPYFLQTPENDAGACPRFARLMNLETTYIPPEYPNGMRSGGRLGCYIDILPLDEVPRKRSARSMADECERNWRRRLRCAPLEEMRFDEMPDWKRAYTSAPHRASYAELTRDLHGICTRYAGKRMRFYTIATIQGNHRAIKLPKRCFEQYIETDFDGLKIRVPAGHAELADIIYENGAELPDEDKREPKHRGYVDTQNPYAKYTARYEKIFEGAREQKILLFGAGNMLNIYMERYGAKYPPMCTFDNDPGKWGKTLCGVTVNDPRKIPELIDGDTRLIIISLYHREIGKQLEKMGVCDYYVFIDGWKYEMRG